MAAPIDRALVRSEHDVHELGREAPRLDAARAAASLAHGARIRNRIFPRYCYVVAKGVQLIVRSEACHNSVPTGRICQPGERLNVSERVSLAGVRDDGGDQTFLRLAEGGFAFEFNRKTGAAVAVAAEVERAVAYTEIKTFAFAFDEAKAKVSVYVDLPGVHDLEPARVAVDFGPRSFDVRVEGLGGANYRLKIPELYDVVDPDKCKFRVKRDKLVLTLKTGIPVVPFSSWQTLTSGSNSDH